MLFINVSPGVWLNLPDRADLETGRNRQEWSMPSHVASVGTGKYLNVSSFPLANFLNVIDASKWKTGKSGVERDFDR